MSPEQLLAAKSALQLVSRERPCPHETLDRSLGNGTIWARCEDCGMTLAVENLPIYRKRAKDFEAAIAVLAAALPEPPPMRWVYGPQLELLAKSLLEQQQQPPKA